MSGRRDGFLVGWLAAGRLRLDSVVLLCALVSAAASGQESLQYILDERLL
jgi:hypothetical protein